MLICLLSVGLTSGGVYIFYTQAYQITIELLRKNLRDVGNVGAMLLDHESREAIKRLKVLAFNEARLDRPVIDGLSPGETTRSISPQKIKVLHASDDFQIILRRLKMINHASFKEVVPLCEEYEFEIISGFNQGMMATYLMVWSMDALPENIAMYLVSSKPEPTADGWPGNPIGNLFRSFDPWSHISQKVQISKVLTTDDFYQSLSGTVPILDDDNNTIAILGVDYAAGPELTKLNRLKWISVSLILGSFILALLFSFFISRALNTPLIILYDAAIRVSQGNYTEGVDIKTRDEFGLLGKVFNQMLANIHNSLRSLKMKNKQLSSVVADMHDGVGSLLTSIVLISQATDQTDQPGALKKLQPIHRLAQKGLAEIRFLMDALEYQVCNLSTLVEEVEMLAADILRPAGIRLEMTQYDNLPVQEVDFGVFLELQRIFQEAFTNIIKHSNADNCTVDIELVDGVYRIQITDNGNLFVDKPPGSGRGLYNIGNRVGRIGGRIEYSHEKGFQIHMIFPQNVFQGNFSG